MFSTELELYNPVGHTKIVNDDPSAVMAVPFWLWQQNKTAVLGVLYELIPSDDMLSFPTALLSDVISHCQCVFSGNRLEIAPRFLPIDVIPSFVNAKRRIYMTATLADDGILISHFKADHTSIQVPIRPTGAGDMGIRMILAPMDLNSDFTFDDIFTLAKTVANSKNVVVITPSNKTSMKWRTAEHLFLDKDNLYEGVERLKNNHVGLVVMANKYDGIDLPNDACELLILDGVPEAEGVISRYNAAQLEGTLSSKIGMIQRIEQGMGRGVRSGEDFCAVLLLGPKLARLINIPVNYSRFTSATRAQLKTARDLSDQMLSGGSKVSIESLLKVLDLSFRKDAAWRTGLKSVVAKTPSDDGAYYDKHAPILRLAFDLCCAGNSRRAATLLSDAANSETTDNKVKGYILQQLAEYTNHFDEAGAQRILMSANELNNRLLKPKSEVIYKRLTAPTSQAIEAKIFMTGRFVDGNDIVLWVDELIADLAWDNDRTDQFEAAIMELGSFLGFASHRPDKITNRGPDNLWAVGNGQCCVIECKSGSKALQISKSESDQLSGSMNWFSQKYPPDVSAIPVLIHPQRKFSNDVSPPANVRLLSSEEMLKLKQKLKSYASSLNTDANFREETKIAGLLQHFNLVGIEGVKAMTSSARAAG